MKTTRVSTVRIFCLNWCFFYRCILCIYNRCLNIWFMNLLFPLFLSRKVFVTGQIYEAISGHCKEYCPSDELCHLLCEYTIWQIKKYKEPWFISRKIYRRDYLYFSLHQCLGIQQRLKTKKLRHFKNTHYDLKMYCIGLSNWKDG